MIAEITETEIRISSRVDDYPRPTATAVVTWIMYNKAALGYLENQPGTEPEQARVRKHLEYLNWLLID